MIAKFNNIFYLIVFLTHFGAYAVYAIKKAGQHGALALPGHKHIVTTTTIHTNNNNNNQQRYYHPLGVKKFVKIFKGEQNRPKRSENYPKQSENDPKTIQSDPKTIQNDLKTI